MIPDFLFDLKSPQAPRQLSTLLVGGHPQEKGFLLDDSLMLCSDVVLDEVQSLSKTDPLVQRLLLHTVLRKV